MIGILDIGSNTIRLVTYENGEKISNISINSEILKDTVNNRLTLLGTQKLCRGINMLKKQAGEIPVFAFATFAFRELENCNDVRDEIEKQTEISVEILSGKDEAECDFLGLLKEIGDSQEGLGIDLGGGSAQIFAFSGTELLEYDSYPIGCKKIKEHFVKDVFPSEEEEKKITEYLEKYLGKIENKVEKIYMMGGSAKTAAKMYGFIKGEDKKGEIPVCELGSIIKFIEDAPEDLMKNVLKARYDNIVIGIMIIDYIAKKCGAEKILVKSCSVRDGYIIKRDI